VPLVQARQHSGQHELQHHAVRSDRDGAARRGTLAMQAGVEALQFAEQLAGALHVGRGVRYRSQRRRRPIDQHHAELGLERLDEPVR